ncbi:hypothetical protein F4777DRAFT_476575 [Nemania sp. FL0916]|nr:hypothetical protein F4777DRAFT_476575 [Nemania sp. FL0916]
MSGEGCARQRFIVWAAVKRNRSTNMAASERLRCPLLLCGERFDGHEEMLRHLAQCQHLSTGEYVCYECMRVERFNDKKCTCCSEQPTKRRRIINMAKHFFSNIGTAKARKDNLNPSIHSFRPCPPSYDSLVGDTNREYSQKQMQDTTQLEKSGRESEQSETGQIQLELNGTELLELDSRPLFPTAELGSADCDGHSTPLLSQMGSRPETKGAPFSSTSNLRPKSRGPQTLPTRQQINSRASCNGGSRRPSLALDTQIDHCRTNLHTMYLSPSSSLQSNSHGISPITPWSTSSECSTIWSTACGQDAMLSSPITPLSPDARLMVQQEHLVSGTGKDTDMLACPEDNCNYALGDMSDFGAESQIACTVSRLPSDPLIFGYDVKDKYSWLSSMNTDISHSTSINMMFTDPNQKTTMPPEFIGSQISNSEVKTLVEQVWDALGEHFSTSLSKLARLQNNSLADSLRTQTPRDVASAGLVRLRRALDHNFAARPDPLEYICFIHLIYSISLIMHGDNVASRSNKLYEQAIAYSALFDAPYRDNYCQVVSTIWHQNSQSSASRGRSGDTTNRTTGDKGKEPDYHISSVHMANPDPLVIAGQDFLDEIEGIMINGNIHQPLDVLSSELWSSHVTPNQTNLQGPSPLTIASAFLVQDLCRRYHDSRNLLSKLTFIGNKARGGYYGTIRKLELELIQTGKKTLTSGGVLDQFIIQVRDLCDQIYSQHGTRPRGEYQLLGISLLESLFSSSARGSQQHQEAHSEFPLMTSYQYEDEFLRDLNKDMGWNFISGTQQAGSPEGVTSFSSALDLAALHPPSDTQLGTGSPGHIPIRSDASESPSNYTISPAPPSDVMTSNPYRPTPPARARGEGLEASGPSTLASSGPKVEASERCEICGYRPKGDPQWFKGSMAKHKKMQHSTNPPVIYKCPYPGCNSEYKNRKDNLRQHQIEKNHFVGDEERPQKRKRREHT